MRSGLKKGAEIEDADDDSDETPNNLYKTRTRTLGQKAADVLTNRVGSWHYIIILVAFLLLWMIINTSMILADESFDPYPFMLLNLVIAAIAAIEVPIILMSQNRQAQRAREREQYDYALDKKSEREIRGIREQLNRIEKKLEK
mgnify:CR=1 FL=1